MIELDGVEYTVKTPDENADDLITIINDKCKRENIKNSLGEVIHVANNDTNPLYQMCYGVAYLTTVLQKLIYNAGCAMSIAEASDRQLLNLADIAGVRRLNATRTIIQGVVSSEKEAGCEITQDMEATVTIAGIDVVFKPAFDVSLGPFQSKPIVFVADRDGSFNIAQNTIKNFDEPVVGLRSIVTLNSIPGSAAETISALRARLQRRGVDGTQCDRAAEAIQQLPGVSLCSIYFNYNPQSPAIDVSSRGIDVPPRTALILVQGYNKDIAKVFYRYMICDTAGKEPKWAGTALTSTYTTHANQKLEVTYFPPMQIPIYIKVFTRDNLPIGQRNSIKDTVASLSANMSIGQPITSVEVIDRIQSIYPDIIIHGCYVSVDNEHWGYIQTPLADQLFVFDLNNIIIQEETK